MYIHSISSASKITVDEIPVSLMQDTVRQETTICIQMTLDQVLSKIALEGGYLYRPSFLYYEYTQDYRFTYLYTNRTNYMPSSDTVTNYIETYI